MNEYRSALRAALLRVEQLETEAASRGLLATARERRVSVSRLLGLFFAVLVATGVFGASGTVWRAIRLPPPPVEHLPPRPSPDEPCPRRGLRWFDQHHWSEGGGPELADIDGDGANDVLGLAWEREKAVDGLYAVALDRKSLGVRWRAGPYAGVWPPGTVDLGHLVVFHDRVVVTDARGGVHVLSARTGETLLERKLGRAIESACVSEDGAPRVFFADASYWQPSSPGDTGASYFPWELNVEARMLFDPMTGNTGPAPRLLGCAHQPTYCSHNPNARAAFVDRCRDLYESVPTPPSARGPAFTGHESWRSGNDRVTVGVLDKTRALMGWTKKDRAVKWQVPLTSLRPAAPTPHGISLSGIGDGSFAHVYTTDERRLSLVVFDVATGAQRFAMDLPGSGLGSELVSVSVDREDVFIGVDDELLVIDAKSGQLRKRIDTL